MIRGYVVRLPAARQSLALTLTRPAGELLVTRLVKAGWLVMVSVTWTLQQHARNALSPRRIVPCRAGGAG
jgi:hypothetical protein